MPAIMGSDGIPGPPGEPPRPVIPRATEITPVVIDGGERMLVMHYPGMFLNADRNHGSAWMMIRVFQSETKPFLLDLAQVQEIHACCEQIMARASADVLKDERRG